MDRLNHLFWTYKTWCYWKILGSHLSDLKKKTCIGSLLQKYWTKSSCWSSIESNFSFQLKWWLKGSWLLRTVCPLTENYLVINLNCSWIPNSPVAIGLRKPSSFTYFIDECCEVNWSSPYLFHVWTYWIWLNDRSCIFFYSTPAFLVFKSANNYRKLYCKYFPRKKYRKTPCHTGCPIKYI